MSEAAFPILSRLVQPTDLHKMTDAELAELAQEVRQAILEKVSKTGGHFSSNLGTVELAVAMYASYSLPPDKVIWDTGHQAYPHKLLTGRFDRFDTLRKHKGISGFLRREEHDLDAFGAGHAGTAISAALGFAVARDLQGTQERVVAITGDAAIGSGMSWEALIHAGDLKTDLTVVLNDNRMSIAPNVGALTSYFTRLRSRPMLQDLAQRAKEMVERLPSPMTRVASGLRHGLTHYFAPEETGTIFEELGFEYIGPVDGHDLPTLLEIFRNVRELRGPLFVHAITVKGKGYNVAEDDARKWHGVVPFDLAACEMAVSSGPVTYTQAFGAAAIEAAEQDDKVVAITAAMPDGTGLTGFAKQFPTRYYDTGIAEQHAVTFVAGLAAGGMKPFCVIYSTFLQRGYDQVLHDVGIQNLPVRFFMDRAGLVGDDGPTHHGVFDISFLNPIPNLTLLAPRDTTELRLMTEWMRGYDEGPTAMRYPRGSGDARLPEARSPIAYGQAEVLGVNGDVPRPRDTVVLLATGSMVSPAWEASGELAQHGVAARVINARFIKPLDVDTIARQCEGASMLVTLEEHVRIGGFGESVRQAVADRLPGLKIHSIAIPDAFIEHGTQAILREQCGLDAQSCVRTVLGQIVEPKRGKLR